MESEILFEKKSGKNRISFYTTTKEEQCLLSPFIIHIIRKKTNKHLNSNGSLTKAANGTNSVFCVAPMNQRFYG
jgi:hypothetical protein